MSKFSIYFFPWQPHQQNWNCIYMRTTNSKPLRLIIMIDQPEKYWAIVRSNLLHYFLEVHNSVAPFTWQVVSWAKPAYFDVFAINFTHWSLILCTSGDASPPVLSMLKLNEESQNMRVWHRTPLLLLHICTVCWGWWKAQERSSPAREACNKYDLTAVPCFWLAHHNNWSSWFAISSLPPICTLNFSCVGGVVKKEITELGCGKYFLRFSQEKGWFKSKVLWFSPISSSRPKSYFFFSSIFMDG
jgi:hypothetical protein